ncbi:MAG: GntR family transcriptional regulator [Novosphingobium sp.]|nr:GntR family transcriptional regulator [Novosphingobium sp.]
MDDKRTTIAASRSRKRRRPVEATADQLRDIIYAAEPDTRIGSLNGLAGELGVGIVTIQQAARVLEHEGLLSVRRGPGGGYYGQRPDDASLERALAAYMRTKPASWEEALDMTSLLFNELVAAAALCDDKALHAEMSAFLSTVDACDTDIAMGEAELTFQDLLFRMVDRPLFELLTRVTLRFSTTRPGATAGQGLVSMSEWKAGRHRIIRAILNGDRELARFEADRSNRRPLLSRLREAAI